MDKRDVFLCHAGIDKDEFVYPFAKAITKHRISYWLDEAEILWGDRITKKISEGLEKSKYVVVFITKAFLEKEWPQVELSNALNLEISSGNKVVLPLLGTLANFVFDKYPLLRDKFFLHWDDGPEYIAERLAGLLGRTIAEAETEKEPNDLQSFTTKILTGEGKIYLTVSEFNNRPYNIFVNLDKAHTRKSRGLVEALCSVISLSLKNNIRLEQIVESLRGISSDHPIFAKDGLILSIPDAISRVLEKRYLIKSKL